MTFTLTREDGGTTWAFLSAGDGSYNLDIIDEAAFKKQLTFNAEEMKRALDEKGHVASICNFGKMQIIKLSQVLKGVVLSK